MKKAYTKPEIVFEDFSLSTNIAAGCEFPSQIHAKDSCGFYFEGVGFIFITEESGCVDREIETGVFSGICYHVPTEDSNVFSS